MIEYSSNFSALPPIPHHATNAIIAPGAYRTVPIMSAAITPAAILGPTRCGASASTSLVASTSITLLAYFADQEYDV